jgi:rhamnosyltransferase subunit B
MNLQVICISSVTAWCQNVARATPLVVVGRGRYAKGLLPSDEQMHAILTSLGTDGDIIPYIGLGARLRRLGHRVTLIVAEDYREQAAEFDLDFVSLVSREENYALLSNPDFWHPIKGAQIGARWGVQRIGPQYDLYARLCESDEALLIASPALIAARVVSEKRGTPLATPILQPWMIKSSTAPPTMPAGLTLPRWAPRPVKSAYWRLFDAAGGLLMGRELNRLRTSVGLGRVSRVFDWWFSPQLVLGLFPDWYGPPQRDWAPQIKLCGFPLFDGRAAAELAGDLAAFCNSGTAPIAFTFGTGMMHGSHLFRWAIEACKLLGARGILLTRHAGQLPAELPGFMKQCSFAPFSRLFPRCRAVVHHGGIGTIANAFAAATPQLVMPIAYDQLDNAKRVTHLGAGSFIKPRHASAARIAELLRGLDDPQIKARRDLLATRLNGMDAIESAVDAIVELFNQSRSIATS